MSEYGTKDSYRAWEARSTQIRRIQCANVRRKLTRWWTHLTLSLKNIYPPDPPKHESSCAQCYFPGETLASGQILSTRAFFLRCQTVLSPSNASWLKQKDAQRYTVTFEENFCVVYCVLVPCMYVRVYVIIFWVFWSNWYHYHSILSNFCRHSFF